MLGNTKTILFIYALLIVPNFASATKLCRTHFPNENETFQSDTTHERRTESGSWRVQDKYGHKTEQNQFPFLPREQSLSVFNSLGSKHLDAETVVRVNGELKLRHDKLPTDDKLMWGVLDGTLESGRRLLEGILNFKGDGQEITGVFIFVDVNNLGYINKNFFNKKETGDSYINGVSDLLLRVIDKKGLLFRLGGDEFGMVLPPAPPAEVKRMMEQIMTELRDGVQEIFRNETKIRGENLRVLKRYYELGLIPKEEYDHEVHLFKSYASYSQAGLSIGASYIDGRGYVAIQKEAESHATAMKINVKGANGQSVAKYSDPLAEDRPAFSGAPNLAYRYKFPELDTQGRSFMRTFTSPTTYSTTNLQVVTKSRNQVEHRFGPISIVKYVSEDGVSETRVEYYAAQEKVARLQKTEILDMHSHSGFIDSKSINARALLNFFSQTYAQARGVVWINVLNLGKLNYFEHGTHTGDRMIKRFAELIRESLRMADVPFKLQGSEFLILVDQVGPYKLDKIKERLYELINTDPEVIAIYNEQIQYLQGLLEKTTNHRVKYKIRVKISETIALRNKPKLDIKTLFWEGPQKEEMNFFGAQFRGE